MRHECFYWDFRGWPDETRQSAADLKSLWAVFEVAMCEAVKMKPMEEWRAKELRDASNADCLPRKAIGYRRQAGREYVCTATGKAKEVGLLKPLEITQTMCFTTAQRVTGSVWPAGCSIFFGRFLLSMPHIPHFWNGNTYYLMCNCVLNTCNLVLIFRGPHNQEFLWVLEEI